VQSATSLFRRCVEFLALICRFVELTWRTRRSCTRIEEGAGKTRQRLRAGFRARQTDSPCCRGFRWHERWLEYRALAEGLRHGRFLAFVSDFGRIQESTPRSGGHPSLWMLWYIRATRASYRYDR
jgi:hypothetical protein